MLFTKVDGKIKISVFSISGIDGQCLLSPPEPRGNNESWDFPFFLYNIGGVLGNLLGILLALPLLLWSLKAHILIVEMFGVMFIFMGLWLIIINGIPLKIGGMDNDAMNIRMMRKSASARRVFYLQLAVNQQLSMGKTLMSMPEDWFQCGCGDEEMPTDVANCVLVVAHRILVMDRYIETLDFHGVEETCRCLFKEHLEMAPLLRSFVNTDLMLAYLADGKLNEAKDFWSHDIEKFFKSMKSHPLIQVAYYGYCKMVLGDDKKMLQIFCNLTYFFESIVNTGFF